MFNKVILVGNLTRDIELRYTPDGLAVAKVGLATNRVYTDPTTKEKKQEVMFIDVVIFGRAAETSHQYLRKGSQVLVEGRLSLNQWIDNSGQKRSKHEVIAETIKFLGGKGGGDYSSPVAPTPKENSTPTQQNSNNRNSSSNIASIDIDEDMPF